MINVFISTENRVNGEWVSLPQENIGDIVDSIVGTTGEYWIPDYESDLGKLNISEYESIESLNELAEKLDSMDEWQIDDLKVILEEYSDIDQALEILESGDYMIRYDIDSEEDLGYALVEDTGILQDMPAHLQHYFDYEKYGRDCCLEGWSIHRKHQAAICIR